MSDVYLTQLAYMGFMLCVASIISLALHKHKWACLILWGVDIGVMLYRTDFFNKYPVHTWSPELIGMKLGLSIAALLLGFRYLTMQHVLAWLNFSLTAILLLP